MKLDSTIDERPVRYETSLLPLIISRVFEPFPLLVAVSAVGAVRAGITGMALLRFLATIIAVAVVPAILSLLIALKLKFVSGWDMSVRRERVRMMLLFCVLIILDNFLIRGLHLPFADRLFMVFTIWSLGFCAITLLWKVSGHTGIATLAAGLVYRWYGAGVWPLFLLIPLIAWARIVGRRHTVSQTAGGIVYSAAVLLFLAKSGIL
jgi:membrane-associated phospholipid phosphatase